MRLVSLLFAHRRTRGKAVSRGHALVDYVEIMPLATIPNREELVLFATDPTGPEQRQLALASDLLSKAL
jgi:hypothetical protein